MKEIIKKIFGRKERKELTNEEIEKIVKKMTKEEKAMYARLYRS